MTVSLLCGAVRVRVCLHMQHVEELPSHACTLSIYYLMRFVSLTLSSTLQLNAWSQTLS